MALWRERNSFSSFSCPRGRELHTEQVQLPGNTRGPLLLLRLGGSHAACHARGRARRYNNDPKRGERSSARYTQQQEEGGSGSSRIRRGGREQQFLLLLGYSGLIFTLTSRRRGWLGGIATSKGGGAHQQQRAVAGRVHRRQQVA